MHVLVCASGTSGDVHPLVAVAEAMHQRGHDVTLLSNPKYEPLAKEAGVEFEPIGTVEELDATYKNPHVWTFKHGWKIWIRDAGLAPMRQLNEAIKRLHRPGSTIVAASYLCFGARIARDTLRIPTATLHLNVHTLRSIHEIHAFPPPSFLPEWLPLWYALPPFAPNAYKTASMWLADRAFIDPLMAPRINAYLKELGQPPIRGYVRNWWTSPDLAIGLFPDWWAGNHPDWPTQCATTGFPSWDRTESWQESPELKEFLTNGDVLVFTPGASSSHTARHFQAFANACHTLNRKGIILTPNPSRLSHHSDRVQFARYIPFGYLLNRASAVVHHAGIGTTAQCLAAGLPQVVVPTLYNQPDTAVRLEHLGVARMILSRRFNEQCLTNALEVVLNSPRVASHCLELASRFEGREPLTDICGHLETLA